MMVGKLVGMAYGVRSLRKSGVASSTTVT
jgi:hypothetical protein